jgi:DNA-directed RNA polymerase subunit RPC12/RpoP
MKPKNKFQQQVFELSKKLPSISATQVKWAYRNCLAHIGRRTAKGVVSCLDCGHSWTDTTTEKHCTCPHCGTKLLLSDTRQRVFKEYEYFCIVTACGGFQVLRFFYIQSYAKAGITANYDCSEVVQRWIAPNGKYATIAKLRPMGYFVDTWCFDGTFEIRPERPLYNIMPTCIYPRQRLIPESKRSGYKGDFYDLTPFNLFHALLTDNRAETLLKAGQIPLLQFFVGNGLKYLNYYWASIKICLRNGYKVTDVSIWRDYIDLLRFFGKDLHNAKYVCPDDLTAEHDRYVKKKEEQQERESKERKRRKALEDEQRFNELKSNYFGIQFTDGLIEVRMLESVEDIMKEGDIMHHCVFANEYHLRPDSLILSACIEDKRIETIEFSLSQKKVVQSRGVCNKNTQYHDRIINLVESNIRLFQKHKRKKRGQKTAA